MTSGSDPADPRARARSIVAEVLAAAAERAAPSARAGDAVSSAPPDAPGDDLAAVEATGAELTVTEMDRSSAAVDDGRTPVTDPERGQTAAPRSEAGEAAHRIVLTVLAARREDAGGTTAAGVVREEAAPVEEAPGTSPEVEPGTAAVATDPEPDASEPIAVATDPEPDASEPIAVAAERGSEVSVPERNAAPEDRMRRLFAASAPESDEDGAPLDRESELIDSSDTPWSLDADLTSAGSAPPRTGRWLLATILGAIALALLFPLAVAALRQVLALS